MTRLLDATGAFAFSRHVLPSWPRILMYHQFCRTGEELPDGTSADVFRQHLEHIARHYRPMRLQELAEAMAARRPIPPRSVALTVDDGHTGFLRYAVPLLEEFQIPATLFVVSDATGERSEECGWLWTDRFMYTCRMAGTPPFSSAAATEAALAALKHTPPAERERRLGELAQRADVEVPTTPPPPYDLLSWSELRKLSASPLFDIGSHTRTHATLCTVDDDQSWEEINGSRRELESRLDAPVTSFCYPNGSASDYRPQHAAMVAKAGYSCATATQFGCVRDHSDRFALPRIACHAGDIARFHKAVDGFELLQRRLRGEPCC
ncbi:MAG TPA: polysaccharide deacetylase family protein [Candidatus Acidoferrales bacterium]|nr:polysaccharide deacetylase family protein [Candidatus Acidoferrales bacterium]